MNGAGHKGEDGEEGSHTSLTLGSTTGSAVDSVTILKSVNGTTCKQIVARATEDPEVRGYNAGTLFEVIEAPVTNIGELSSLLQLVEKNRRVLVIRGALRSDLNRSRQHRRRKVNFQTPSRGRPWILIDFDKIPLPDGLSLQHDICAVCEYLIGLLPPEFHAASYHWQLSSSAGVGDPSRVSMHMWFWLDRPIPEAQLKSWGNSYNVHKGMKIVDTALFNDVQAHYTAAPTFTGMADPFPVRSGLVRKDVHEVALVLPPPATGRRGGQARSTAPFEASGGFEAILGQIGDHPGGQGFHLPIIRAVASFVATNGADIDVDALYEVVRSRVLDADRSHHSDSDVEHKASREHIVPAIMEAIVKFAPEAQARRKPRQIPGVPPHFTGRALSADAASALLKEEIRAFFGP